MLQSLIENNMFSIILLSCISVAFAAPANSGQDFTNFRLISVKASTQQQMQVLEKLQADGLNGEFYDFWADPSTVRNAEIMVSPAQYQIVLTHLRANGLDPQIDIENIQTLVDRSMQRAKTVTPLNFNNIVDHGQYHTLNTINNYANSFVSTYPTLVKKHQLSERTYLGKTMEYLEISTDFAGTKPAIIIEATIHAREWISPASVLYFVDRLLGSSASDSQFMLNNFDWYVLLVANPDGYEYTHTNYRMWRKNRSPGNGNCYGVDLNRNFEFRWGLTGTSNNCGSDIYLGPSPMSEVESRNIKEMVDSVQDGGTRAIGFLAIHSYSQMILLPYSFNYNERPPNANELDNYGYAAGSAMSAVNGKNFQVGTGPNLLYPAAGGSDDWAIALGSVKYAYTYELRPRTSGEGGFVLPTSDIIPSGEELYASFYSLAQSFASDKKK